MINAYQKLRVRETMSQVLLTSHLKSLFDQCLQSSLKEYLSAAQWNFAETDSFETTPSEEALFLSICSHQFRIFVSLHFTLSHCKGFIARALNVAEESVDNKAAYDFLLEVGNNVCGMFKRELGHAVPALGMSTPNILDRGSFSFVDLFNSTSKRFQNVELDGQPLFCAGYYFCPNVSEEIEVEAPEQVIEDDVDVGELELF